MSERVYQHISMYAEFSASTRWLAIPFAIAFGIAVLALIAGGLLARHGRKR